MGELPTELRRLCDCGLDVAGAANDWAGTSGLELVGALNAKNGTTGLELEGVLNALAGTTGKGVNAAAAAITGVVDIARTLLTASSSETPGTSFVTASITPSANVLVLLAVNNHVLTGTADTVSSVTGNGLTWVQVGTSIGGLRRVSVFRAMGAAPSAGTVTIDFGLASQASAEWEITEWSGVDTSGTNGSGAIVQSRTNSGGSATPPSVTFLTAPAASSAVFVAFGTDADTTMTPDAGYSLGAQDVDLHPIFAVSNADISPSGTYSPQAAFAGVAAEIKIAP